MRFYTNTAIICVLMGLKTTFLCAQKQIETKTALPLSLSEVWQKADAFSKAIQIKKTGLEASHHKVKDAYAERLPELSVGGNIEKATNIPIYENGLFHKPTQHEVIHTLYKINAEGYFNIYNGGKTNININKGGITRNRYRTTESDHFRDKAHVCCLLSGA
ncbi:TolC family protein [Pedobacter steynii]